MLSFIFFYGKSSVISDAVIPDIIHMWTSYKCIFPCPQTVLWHPLICTVLSWCQVSNDSVNRTFTALVICEKGNEEGDGKGNTALPHLYNTTLFIPEGWLTDKQVQMSALQHARSGFLSLTQNLHFHLNHLHTFLCFHRAVNSHSSRLRIHFFFTSVIFNRSL